LRVVFDPNVIISATLSPGGTPALLYELWRSGAFELVVSPKLLRELEGVLAREKFADLVHPDEVAQLLLVVTSDGALVPDPAEEPKIRSADPDDDYLIALASHSRSLLISGDKDLLDLSDQIPVYSPAQFRSLIEDAIGDTT
jgi:putative PIN family toxin of toxin-antitoxin system